MTLIRTRVRIARRAVVIAAAALAVASALSLASCGAVHNRPAPTGSHSTAAAAGDAPSVPSALAFHAMTVDGKPFDGASLAGKPAVVWFWAPWCSACRAEVPTIKAAADAYAGKAAFVGIAGLADTSAMRGFVADADLGGFPQLADTDGALWAGFDVVAQPALAFVHPDGHVEVAPGPMDAASLDGRIKSLLSS